MGGIILPQEPDETTLTRDAQGRLSIKDLGVSTGKLAASAVTRSKSDGSAFLSPIILRTAAAGSAEAAVSRAAGSAAGYIGFAGQPLLSINAVEANVEATCMASLRVQKIDARISANTLSANGAALTLRKDNADTALSCALGQGTGTVSSGVANAQTIVAGSRYNLALAVPAGAGSISLMQVIVWVRDA